MSDELKWRLVMYPVLLAPMPALVWASIRWRGEHAAVASSSRRLVTGTSFLLLTISQITLLLFPEVLELAAGKPLDPSDDIYIRAIQLGFVGALLGALISPLARKRTRLPLGLTGVALLVEWFFAGNSV
jgi:hypothetical protein